MALLLIPVVCTAIWHIMRDCIQQHIARYSIVDDAIIIVYTTIQLMHGSKGQHTVGTSKSIRLIPLTVHTTTKSTMPDSKRQHIVKYLTDYASNTSSIYCIVYCT